MGIARRWDPWVLTGLSGVHNQAALSDNREIPLPSHGAKIPRAMPLIMPPPVHDSGHWRYGRYRPTGPPVPDQRLVIRRDRG